MVLTVAELERRESELDNVHRAYPLLNRRYNLAAWHLLACADYELIGTILHAGSHQLQRVGIDTLVNVLKHPLGWIFHGCRGGGRIPSEIDEEVYAEAKDLLGLGRAYDPLTAMFPLAHRGIVELSAEDNRLWSEHTLAAQPQYEAYNRLTSANSGLHGTPDLSPVFDIVGTALAKGHQTIAVPVTAEVLRVAEPLVAETYAQQYTLPRDWQFSSYNLGEFADVNTTVRSIAYAWLATKALGVHASKGAAATGGPLVLTRRMLHSTVRARTGLPGKIVHAVLQDMVYGSRDIQNPDPALQPLIELGDGVIAVALLPLLATAPERNLLALLNHIPAERRIYSRLVDGKEQLMRERIKQRLGNRFRYYSGPIPGREDLPDVDLAVISDEENVAIMLELKWFIAPAEIRDVTARSKDLRKGTQQCKTLSTYASENSARFEKLLGLRPSFVAKCAVLSENWIGHADVQHGTIPILTASHLCARLNDNPSLLSALEWIDRRSYLPVEGTHFQTVETQFEFAGRRIEWYGIKPLVPEMFLPVD